MHRLASLEARKWNSQPHLHQTSVLYQARTDAVRRPSADHHNCICNDEAVYTSRGPWANQDVLSSFCGVSEAEPRGSRRRSRMQCKELVPHPDPAALLLPSIPSAEGLPPQQHPPRCC